MGSRIALPFLALAVLVLFVGGSCIIPLSQPAATNTPIPPIATRVPTKVPTKAPTPDYAATAQAQVEGYIISQLQTFELPFDTGYIGWAQTDPVAIDLEGPGGFYNTFAEDLNVSDFVIQMDMTWDTTAWPWCGIFFRSDSSYADGSFYVIYFLRFSGLPAWDIEYFRDGAFVSQLTQKYQFSNWLDINSGATNQIMLAAQDNQFKVYVNGHYEGVYYDYSSKLDQGRFAYIAYEDSGTTTCTFNNTWIWVYK
jgi:hypothetical protein